MTLFLGSFSLAKTLEWKLKQGINSGLNSGTKEPTVIPPQDYHERFVKAIETYFLACPGMSVYPFTTVQWIYELTRQMDKAAWECECILCGRPTKRLLDKMFYISSLDYFAKGTILHANCIDKFTTYISCVQPPHPAILYTTLHE